MMMMMMMMMMMPLAAAWARETSMDSCWRRVRRTGYRLTTTGARVVAAGSVMLRAEVRGSTRTRWLCTVYLPVASH